MRNKVLIETSVLISASIFSFLHDMNEEIKHEFYERSMKLIGYLATNISKRIGVVTSTIEREAFGVLEKAVRNEIDDKSIDYRTMSIILNACNDRLRRNVEILVREPIERKRVDELFVRVSAMYALLNQRAELLDKGTLKAVAREKAKVGASKRFRGIATAIYAKQEYDGYSQLRRLYSKKASPADMMIIAEAAYLREALSKEKEVMFHVASTDTHMSPFTVDEKVVSSIVTDEITANFGIYCDWPERVLEKISQSDG